MRQKRIKLLIIIDYIYKITGGTEKQVVRMIKNLDNNKYELHLLTLCDTQWIVENELQLGCKGKRFNYKVFNLKDLRNLASFFGITKYIKKIRPDIVITFFPTSYILGVFAARLAGVKNIVSTRRDYGLWLSSKKYIYLLKIANRFVGRLLANSQNVKNIASEREGFDSARINVIYNGIEIEQFNHNFNVEYELRKNLGIPENNKVVGIVAGLRPMKRHETFLKAAEKLLKTRSDISFVLVGDGPLRNELETLTDELKISGNIYFAGWQENMLPYLSIFDIGVNCSSKEGLSNAIMEYMAYGVPCIVSNAGGNTELIEHGVNGYVFELDNDKELAGLILSLLKDAEMQKSFVLKSKDIISSKFSVERMIADYDKFFAQILKS